ncbi:hypothetical protein L8106_27671, partial [Lyngbya sp. PCC 8106]
QNLVKLHMKTLSLPVNQGNNSTTKFNTKKVDIYSSQNS